MTTLTDRPNAALLVIDAQSDVVGGAHNRDAVVANIATLVDKARDVPVVWVQHSSNLYWGNHTSPGRQAGRVTTATVDFG